PGPAHSRSRRVLAPQSAHLLLAAQIELAAPGYFIAPRLRWPPSPCRQVRGAPQRSALDEHRGAALPHRIDGEWRALEWHRFLLSCITLRHSHWLPPWWSNSCSSRTS